MINTKMKWFIFKVRKASEIWIQKLIPNQNKKIIPNEWMFILWGLWARSGRVCSKNRRHCLLDVGVWSTCVLREPQIRRLRVCAKFVCRRECQLTESLAQSVRRRRTTGVLGGRRESEIGAPAPRSAVRANRRVRNCGKTATRVQLSALLLHTRCSLTKSSFFLSLLRADVSRQQSNRRWWLSLKMNT